MKVQLVLDLTDPFVLGFRAIWEQFSSSALQVHLYLLYWQVPLHSGQHWQTQKAQDLLWKNWFLGGAWERSFKRTIFPKKGQVFQKGWTTSTPAVTDGWVFQKILPWKLAGDRLFSCFWQELGGFVKNNKCGMDRFPSSILFLCESFNCFG